MDKVQINEFIARAKFYINKGYKHEGYDEKIKIRNFYLQAITGEDIDNLLPQFERRETSQLWEQRKAITIENLSPVMARLLNYFYKVARTPKNKKVTSLDERKNVLISERIQNFYSGADMSDYIEQTIQLAALIDPNAFTAIAINPFSEGEAPKPYPILFDCSEVYDFGYDNSGELSFVWTKIDSILSKKDANGNYTGEVEEISDYYLFLAGYIINFKQVTTARDVPQTPVDTFNSLNGKSYYIIIQETGTKNTKVKNIVQAKPLGYIKHKKHKLVFVSPIEPARSPLKELIRRKSGLDLSIEHHVHPQLFMYSEKCPGEIHINQNRKCVGGRIAGTEQVCTVCGGDSLKPIRSAQEYIKVPIPDLTQQNISIDKWAYYNSPDIKPVEYLDKRISQLEGAILTAVFNTDNNQRYNGQTTMSDSQTATEVYLKRDAINNTLKPFATHISEIYKFYGYMFGVFFDVPVEARYEYITDKFEPITLEEITALLKALIDAGADEILIEEVQAQLATHALENDSEKLKAYKIKRKFLPFKGKSADQIKTLITMSVVSTETKVLWANFGDIFSALEMGNESLYDKDLGEVKKLIDTQVSELVKLTESQNPINQVASTGFSAVNKAKTAAQ